MFHTTPSTLQLQFISLIELEHQGKHSCTDIVHKTVKWRKTVLTWREYTTQKHKSNTKGTHQVQLHNKNADKSACLSVLLKAVSELQSTVAGKLCRRLQIELKTAVQRSMHAHVLRTSRLSKSLPLVPDKHARRRLVVFWQTAFTSSRRPSNSWMLSLNTDVPTALHRDTIAVRYCQTPTLTLSFATIDFGYSGLTHSHNISPAL